MEMVGAGGGRGGCQTGFGAHQDLFLVGFIFTIVRQKSSDGLFILVNG